MKYTQQCRNMVEQQIRPWEVLDDRVLDTYYEIPRHHFVPPEYATHAFTDTQLPIGHGQMMLEPKVEARILQELAPRHNEKILHIGTGTGYFAALLGRLCGTLVTIEINPELAAAARLRLQEHGISNATVILGDGLTKDLLDGAPFDAAVLTGSVPFVSNHLFSQLAEETRLVAPIGTAPVVTVTVLQRVNGALSSEDLFDTWVPPLTNAPQNSRFTF